MAELANISDTVAEFVQLAQQQLAGGDMATAEQTARAVISLQPSAIAGWHTLGEVLSAEPGRRAEAAEAFSKALLLDPNNKQALGGRRALSDRATAAPNIHEMKPGLPHLAAMGGKEQLIADARAAEASELWAEARKCWEEVLALDASDTWAWSQFGHLLSVHLHSYAEAEAAFRRAIEEDPTDDWAWGKLGIMIADFQGRVAEGQALLREAIRLDPAEPYYHGWLGWSLYRQSENLEAAEVELLEATRLQNDYQWAHFHLGYVRYAMGSKPKLARANFQRAIDLDPDDVAVLFNMGVLYSEQFDDQRKAEKYFAKILKLEPDHVPSHFKLATIYEGSSQNFDKAKYHYQQILLSHPADLGALRALAYLYSEKLMCFDDARLVFLAALNIAPDDADLHYRFGCMLWYDLDEIALGISHLKSATELAPDIELGWASLGEALAAGTGDFEQAEHCYLKALELEPDYHWVHAHYGAMLYFDLNRHLDARKHLEKALEIEPDYGWAWSQYGNLLCYHFRDFVLAQTAFEKAIALDTGDISPVLELASMQLLTLKNPAAAADGLAVLKEETDASGFVTGLLALAARYDDIFSPKIDALLKQAAEMDAGSHWCLHTYAEHLLYVRGDIGEAEEMILRSMRLEHDCAEVSSDLGLVRLAQGEQDIARALYEKALEDDDENQNSWRLYGIFLANIGEDAALVEEAFARAIEYGDHNFENHLFLSHYLQGLGDREEEAADLLAQAKSLAPKGFDTATWADLHMNPLVLRQGD